VKYVQIRQVLLNLLRVAIPLSGLSPSHFYAPVSSSNKTDCHDITVILLLKVALSTITTNPNIMGERNINRIFNPEII
jgi:hypothetical protein